MRKSPSNSEMMNPTNAQGGTPNYMDESADSANNNFYPKRGDDAPAYMGSTPRYWEYR